MCSSSALVLFSIALMSFSCGEEKINSECEEETSYEFIDDSSTDQKNQTSYNPNDSNREPISSIISRLTQKSKTGIQKQVIKSEVNAMEVDDTYLMQYGTKLAFHDVDEFGLNLKYNKSEHVYYGNTATLSPRVLIKALKNHTSSWKKENHIHSTSLDGSYVFPYLDANSIWRVKRESMEDMFPTGFEMSKVPILNIKFLLYTRKTEENQTNVRTLQQLDDSDFVPKRKTIFLIHGWQNAEDKSYTFGYIRKAYLHFGDYNVFQVDWSCPTAVMNYYTAANCTLELGKELADFIKMLIKTREVSPKKIKLIGHSMGAHAAGIAGKKLKGRLRSIFGLDPARLLYSKNLTEQCLDKSDARFVEIGHSSLIGVFEPIGDVDYYFNNGYGQPSCWVRDIACDHSIILQYYLQSLMNPREFKMERCENMDKLSRNKCALDTPRPKYVNVKRLSRRFRGIFNVNTRRSDIFDLNEGDDKKVIPAKTP